MKKRILALAMTLVMVFSSMAVLSTVSFAADGTDHLHFDASWNTVSAYHATIKVDGTADKYTMVQEYLSNSTRYGAAWDYNNLYLVFASAGKKVTSVDFIVGAQPAKLNVATATVTGIAGATAKGNGDYIEVAIPMKEIFLHFTPETAYAPLELKVVSESATAETKVNIEITGKAVLEKYTAYDGNTGFTTASGTNNGALNGSTHTVAANGELTFATAKSMRAQITRDAIVDFIDPYASGIAISGTWDICVKDLPAVSAPATMPHGHAAGITPGLSLQMATRNFALKSEPASIGAFIYNDSTDGLVLALSKDASRNYYKFDLDVAVDTYFRVTIDVDANSIASVYVNGELKGTGYVAPHNTSIATAKASLETSLLGVGTTPTKVIVRNISVSLEPKVDYTKLKSVAKNAGEATDVNVVAAISKYSLSQVSPSAAYDAVVLGSVSDIAATWNKAAESLQLFVRNSNINKITLKNGANTAVVTLTRTGDSTNGFIDKAAISGIDGATATLELRNDGRTMINLPMNAVTVTGESGAVYAAFEITLETETGVVVTETVNVWFELSGVNPVNFSHRLGCYTYGLYYGNTNLTNLDAYKGKVNLYTGTDIYTSREAYKFTLTNNYQDTTVDPAVTGALRNHFQFSEGQGATAFNTAYALMTDGTRYISFDFKATEFNAVTIDKAVYTDNLGNGGNGDRIYFTLTQDRTALNGNKLFGIDATMYLAIPANGTADDATFVIAFKGGAVVDTGAKLGELVNIKLDMDVKDKSFVNVYIDGELAERVTPTFIDQNSYYTPSSSAMIAVNTIVETGHTVTYEYSNFYTGFTTTETAAVTDVFAMSANTIFDQPEVTDPEEMIELYAVQNKGKASDEDYAQRLVATIDTLDYKYAGFQIAVPSVGVETYRVYDANTSILDGDETTAIEGKYFITYTLDETDEFITGTAFVRAFAVDADRNYVYGDTYKVTIDSNGVLASAELVVNPDIFN